MDLLSPNVKASYLLRQLWLGLTAKSSADYWERRYVAGLTSGRGSYGELARFKAEVLNEFVREHAIASVIELGCGDGNQLSLAEYPRYLGLDVSRRAIDLCTQRFRADSSKAFRWYDSGPGDHSGASITADLVISLDVIYHLIEDSVYHAYLRDLFSMARRFAVIYSSDTDDSAPAAHVRHRRFTRDVAGNFPEFRLAERIANRHPELTLAEFFVYERVGG